ncbi:hypothetical protein MMC17_007986 [Xylographa soralifera]|nr:hypothetical protein [Xylographa soralifera]
MAANTSLSTIWPYQMAEDNTNNDREATELDEQLSSRHAQSSNHDGIDSAVDGRPRARPLQKEQHILKKFWKRQIAVTVDHEGCRDHFALERTYLGYMRTSTVFATIGVTVAQVFRLKNEGAINPPFGFFALGIPLACACIGSALVVTVVGSWRFWRQQNALARGKIHAGGWEINTIVTITILLIITLLVLILAAETLDASD